MKLKEIRLNRKMTQETVANLLGVAKNTYYQYENEIRKISPYQLCELANIFDVSVDELLGRIPEQQLFDNAKVPKSEVQELYDKLPPFEQGVVLDFLKNLNTRCEAEHSKSYRKNA